VTTIAARWADVKERVEAACERAGRRASDVTIVAVSKTHPASAVVEAALSGATDFGENYAQELADKIANVALVPDLGPLRWHFIGRLQRNKVGKLVPMADVIHSIDSVDLARQVGLRAERPVQVLLEVNVSGEDRKGGVAPSGLPELVEAVLEIRHLDLIGLMTMAPRVEDPELARPAFRQLAELRARMAETYSYASIHHLSMGMSQDYRVAIEEGSTMVRVGEAIFGPRAKPRDPSESER
jgi:hypothetical protein